MTQQRNEPLFLPSFVKNEKGMQGNDSLAPEDMKAAREVWKEAYESAQEYHKTLQELGVHKQHANRLLEPFQVVQVLVTATEWDNFFKLRLNPAAQPEMQELASSMLEAMEWRNATISPFHVPLVEDLEGASDEDKVKVSVARCARVSYGWKERSLEEDIDLYERLKRDEHFSPFEHQAIRNMFGEESRRANFLGWISLREWLSTGGTASTFMRSARLCQPWRGQVETS